MPKRYIPTILRPEAREVRVVPDMFAIGFSPSSSGEVGMKAGPYPIEESALENIAEDGDFIYRLSGDRCIPSWRWEEGGWTEYVEVPATDVSGGLLPVTHSPVKQERVLSEDQASAWAKLKVWVFNKKPYFVLKGFAGTGKTYLLEKLQELSSDVSIYYSAPTNKATKVLSRAVGVPAKTTYSMLGLRMEQVDDRLVLTPSGNLPYFPSGSILVVDEGGMSGTTLCEAIEQARVRCDLKVLYVGDPAQLPPVGEVHSPAWRITEDPSCRAMLRKVMRFDNQLLTLATRLRECIREKNWESPLVSDHDETGGVWKWKSQAVFERALLKRVEAGELEDSKVIAWRNKTVNRYNLMIRDAMGFKDPYCVGDSLLLAEPIQRNGTIIAHIDDEFKVTEVNETILSSDNERVEVWRLSVVGETILTLDVPKDPSHVDVILGRKAAIAQRSSGKERKAAWKDFWETKARFDKVRYGYAFTAHRSQGSTHTNVWVDQMDILSNPNKREGFRCLYVAATRPSKCLYSF